MREIKFRGMNKSGEWFYGFLTIGLDSFFIVERHDIPPSMIDPCGDTLISRDMILPQTVGQYTGLLDKNGKEIYEGDVVDGDMSDGEHCTYSVTFDYDRDYAGWNIEPGWCDDIEIVGNVHENPELLE